MTTANEKLLDDAIHRATMIERFKAGEVRSIMSMLNRDVFPELFLLLSNRLDRIASRGHGVSVNRFQTLLDMTTAIGELLRAGASAAQQRLGSDLVELASMEAKWQARVISEAIPIPITVALPAREVLRAAVLSQPMDGHLLRDYFKTWTRNTQQAVTRSINLGLANGEATDQIVRRIRGTREAGYKDGVLNLPRHRVQGIVTTSVSHATNAANEAVYKANADIVKGARWVATLDLRTCLICAGRDGVVYEVGKGPRPPAHPGKCRCRMASVLKSWKELGIPLKDIPEGTRASMDGQVPRSTTFGEWIKAQSAARQNQVLGPTRAAQLRSGEMDIQDFTDDQGRILTLEELALAG